MPRVDRSNKIENSWGQGYRCRLELRRKHYHRQLIDAANFIVGEKVQVVNINNGERLETYIIEGKRASGEVTLNGPAAQESPKETLSSLLDMRKWNLTAKNLSLPLFFPTKTPTV